MTGEHNRSRFLRALRSGEYPKGPIGNDDRGRPLGNAGFCAVGLMDNLFNPHYTSKGRIDALGLTIAQIRKIQQQWNDSDLTFPQIADLIEWEMFTEPAPEPLPQDG